MSYLQDRLAARHNLPAGWLVIEWVNPDTGVMDTAMSYAVVSYTVTAGRTNLDADVEATTAQIVVHLNAAGRIPDVAEPVQLRLGADLAAALALPANDRARFTGEVTNRQISGRYLTVAAAGRRSRLGTLHVGDAPWPAELDGARAARILGLAQAQLPALNVGVSDLGTVQILPRDIDRQPALGLFDKLTDSTPGQLVERRNGEISWHDAEHRRNLTPVAELDPHNITTKLQWESGRDGLVNTLTVTYGVAPAGGDRPSVAAVDTAGIAALGPLTANVDTELADQVDAQTYADLTVGRRSAPWWDIPTLPVELARSINPAQLPGLLAAEHGRAVRVTGLPRMHPLQTTRVMVEGYSETMTPAGWALALAVADAALASPPIRWDDIDAGITWDEVDPAVTWNSAARWQQDDPTQLGRWLDVPADLHWDDVDPAITWDTYTGRTN